MGYAINPNDVIEVTMFGTYQASYCLNVFHFINGGALIDAVNSDAEMTNLLGKFKAALWDGGGTGLKSLMTDGYRLEWIRGQPVAPTRRYYLDYGVGEAGSVAGDGIPSDTHMCVTTRSGAVGRGRTGNKKITGLSLATLDGANFTAASRIAMNLAFNPLLTPLDSLTAAAVWQLAVWSPASSTGRNPVLSLSSRSNVRVMRRRELFRGI